MKKILVADNHREITEELLFLGRHFKGILDNMSEGVIEITPDYRIIYVNAAAIGLSGVSEEELLSSNFFQIFDKEQQPRLKSLFDKMKVNDNKIDCANLTFAINGNEVLINTLFLKGERHNSIVAIIRDVTEQKQIEYRLRQAQKMEAISTLSGGIVHNFNNLLMGILGNISIMLMNFDPGHPEYERLKNLESYVEKGANLSKRLLAYARGDKYRVESTDLNNLIKEQSRMFGQTRKDITIKEEYEDHLWTVDVDGGQIEEVIFNLYINASQAMPGCGKIFIKTENVLLDKQFERPYEIKHGRYVKITVADTGVGIDEKTLEQIFVPFFTTKDVGCGTGLGLAFVYRIIKNHGGIVDVKSKKGEGTSFYIYLPASENIVIKKDEVSEEVIKSDETVLLVDDEDMILDIDRRRCEQYRV